MRCYACGAEMREQPIRLEDRFGRVHVVVENMPAHVCPECGEEVVLGPALVALERYVERRYPRDARREPHEQEVSLRHKPTGAFVLASR